MSHDPCSSWHGINSLGMMTGAVMIAVMTGAGTTAGTTGEMTGGTTGGRMIGCQWHGCVGGRHLSCGSGQGPLHHISPKSSFIDDLHTFKTFRINSSILWIHVFTGECDARETDLHRYTCQGVLCSNIQLESL